MANDWFKNIDSKAPKYRRQIHNVMSRDFINSLKEEHKELVGMKERDIITIVRDFHKDTVIPYVLANRAPLEMPFNMGDLFIGLINGEYPSIYFSAIRLQMHGIITRTMWRFTGSTDFRRRMWSIKNTIKKWKKWVKLENRSFVSTAIRKIGNKMIYRRNAKKPMDLSKYNEFEMN